MNLAENSTEEHQHVVEGTLFSLFSCAVPQDSIERITRFLSKRTNHLHAQCFVEPADVLALLGANELLRTETQNQFISFSLVQEGRIREYNAYELETKQKGLLLRKAIFSVNC